MLLKVLILLVFLYSVQKEKNCSRRGVVRWGGGSLVLVINKVSLVLTIGLPHLESLLCVSVPTYSMTGGEVVRFVGIK